MKTHENKTDYAVPIIQNMEGCETVEISNDLIKNFGIKLIKYDNELGTTGFRNMPKEIRASHIGLSYFNGEDRSYYTVKIPHDIHEFDLVRIFKRYQRELKQIADQGCVHDFVVMLQKSNAYRHNFDRFLQHMTNEVELCYFTNIESRLYRKCGKNTYYMTKNGEFKTAEGLIAHTSITSNLKRCCGCDKRVIDFYGDNSNDDVLNWYEGEDGYLCPDCEKNIQDCDLCGANTLGHFCHSCDTDENTALHEYGYRPRAWSYYYLDGKKITRNKKQRFNKGLRITELLQGYELEIDTNEDERDYIEDYSNDVRHALGFRHYCTEDGSVPNGFELHNHPSTLAVLKKYDFKGLAQFRSYMSSYNTDSCGLHVHLNRNAFSNYHFLKFARFLQDNLALCVGVANRKSISNGNRYAPFKLRFLYDLKRSIMQNCVRSADYRHKAIENKYFTLTMGDKYEAINLKSSNTIELRFFGGSLQKSKLMTKFEYIDAVYNYTLNSSYTAQNIHDFKEFVNDSQRYKNLANYFETKNGKMTVQYNKQIPNGINLI